MAEFAASDMDSQMWVAMDDDRIIGSIAVVKSTENTAQLRWFFIESQYQGQGIGKKLLDTAMQFCRVHEYNHIFLWTINTLDTAKYLYEKYGFIKTIIYKEIQTEKE